MISQPKARSPSIRKSVRYYQLIFSLIGLVASFYALFVEIQLNSAETSQVPYEPFCDNFGYSCTRVFTSSYGHILSHFGLVSRGHWLDLSLASIGVLLNTAYAIFFSIPGSMVRKTLPMMEWYVLGTACMGVFASLYLLYVLKFVLEEVCVVCATFHICNFSMFALATIDLRNSEGSLINGSHVENAEKKLE